MPLSLDAPVLAIDQRLATRRSGSRQKSADAHVVLAEGLGVETVGDLLHHYPRRYIDRSKVSTIARLRVGEYATVIGTVRSVQKRLTRRRQTMVTVALADATGVLELAFFNQPWIASMYRSGTELAVSGVASRYGRKLQLANQEVEILRGDERDLVHMGRITPVHPATDGISARTIRELVHRALEQVPTMADPMPTEILAVERLSDLDTAVRHIHFPADDRELHHARTRLKFDELFVLELGVGFRKRRLAAEAKGVRHEPETPLAKS